MKTLKKIAIFLLIIATIIPIAVPENADAATKLNVKSKTLELGKSFNLKVSGAKKIYDIGSSNYKIVKLKKKSNKTIKVTAVGIGKATISVTAGDKKTLKTLKCKVTVKQPDIENSIIHSSNKTYMQFISHYNKPLDVNYSIVLKNNQNATVWRNYNTNMILVPETPTIIEIENYAEDLLLSLDYKTIKLSDYEKELEIFSQIEFSGITTQTLEDGSTSNCVLVKNNSKTDIFYLDCDVLFYSTEGNFLAHTTGFIMPLYADTETTVEIDNFKELYELYPDAKLKFCYKRLGLY